MAFHPTEISPESAPDAAPAPAARPRLTRTGLFALALTVACFAYEIPLVYVSGFYKANPYLFDVAAINLVFYWLIAGRNRGWVISISANAMLAPWTFITGVFVFATAVSATWVPFNHYVKSAWYCLKYVEGLIVLLIFFSAPIDARTKRRLLWVALGGGTWVSFYAVLQLFGIVSTVRVIPRGTEILQEGYGIYSTLGVTYFHAGFFGLVSGLVGLSLFQTSRGFARLVAGVLAPFATIPAVIAGSRAAFLGLLISLGILAVQPAYRKRMATWAMAAVLGFTINFFWTQGVTKVRVEEQKESRSATFRLLHGPRTLMRGLQEHGALMLVAGGGFMVVPLDGHFRPGYGNHNIHLFPLEQGGLGAFAGMLWLWYRLGTALARRRRPWETSSLDESYRGAMLAFFVAVVLVGWSGTSFWVYSFNEHFAFYELLLFGIALTPTAATRAMPGETRADTGSRFHAGPADDYAFASPG